jgi:hypothetical protein
MQFNIVTPSTPRSPKLFLTFMLFCPDFECVSHPSPYIVYYVESGLMLSVRHNLSISIQHDFWTSERKNSSKKLYICKIEVFTGNKCAKIFSGCVNVELQASVTGISPSNIIDPEITSVSIVIDPGGGGDLWNIGFNSPLTRFISREEFAANISHYIYLQEVILYKMSPL